MDFSVLYPPNSKWVDDGVIGRVIERGRWNSLSFTTKITTSEDSSTSSLTWVINTTQEVAKTKRIKHNPHNGEIIRDELRRERLRQNSARHREKQLKRLNIVESTIRLLREDIQMLELQRQLVASGVPERMTSWNIVAEYFRLFRYGLKAPPSVENSRSTESLSSYAYPTHRNFLQATVAEDIVLDRGFGVDALMEDWKSISLHHRDLNISLVRLENGIGNSLVATVQAHCKISEDSIGHIFPHLVNDDDGEHARLVTKLVGQSLGIPCTVCFVWDDVTEEIVSMHYTSDMMTPLMRILGSLEDVSRVLGGSSAQLPVTGFSD